MDDPDPVPDSKAAAAFSLAVLGLATGVLIGGVIPATIALVLARQASAELDEGAGWRLGDRQVLWARRLAWAAIALAAVAVTMAIAVALVQGAGLGDRDYPSNVN